MMPGREFCRFVRSRDVRPDVPTSLVPAAGLCLSAFVAITDRNDPQRVLMGIINRDAPWDRLGALSASLVERFSKGWMLPSSHLLLFEHPLDGARRVLKEQLGLEGFELSPPIVFSDVYDHPITRLQNHWDIGFIFKGSAEPGSIHATSAWSRLEFVDPAARVNSVIRSHDDVLRYCGIH